MSCAVQGPGSACKVTVMRMLYHYPLDAGSRKIRLLLAPRGLEAELKTENAWERREAFLGLNPAGDVPVLLEQEGAVVPGHDVIAEYLEETYPDPPLLGEDKAERIEVRRLV